MKFYRHEKPLHGLHERVWSMLCWAIRGDFVLSVEEKEYVVTVGGVEHRMARSVPAARAYIAKHLDEFKAEPDPTTSVSDITLTALTNEWRSTAAVADDLGIDWGTAAARLSTLYRRKRIERGEIRQPRRRAFTVWRLPQ